MSKLIVLSALCVCMQPNVTGHITVVESGHGATPVSFGAVTTVDAKVRHSLHLF